LLDVLPVERHSDGLILTSQETRMAADSLTLALQARLDQLERRVRFHRIALCGAGLALAAGFACAMAPAKDDDKKPQELTVTRLVVVDDKGMSRIEIGPDPAGTQRRSPSTGIVIRDASGAERFGVGVMEDDRVTMGFDAPVGVGNPMRDRLAIGCAADGAAYVMLIDNATDVPVRLVTKPKGGGGLEFIGYDKPNSKVIIKRNSFDGENKEEMHHDFPKEVGK
jgi:hypothetical protein